MTLVPVRAFLIVVGILVAIGFGTGHLHWNSKQQACFNGRHFYGDWFVAWSVGKLEFRQHAYGCATSDQYDPKQFKPLYDRAK